MTKSIQIGGGDTVQISLGSAEVLRAADNAVVIGGKLVVASVHVESVAVTVAEQPRVNVHFMRKVELPRLLFFVDGDGARLRTEAELREASGGFVDQVLALRDEALRRLAQVEIDLSAGGFVFLGAKAPFGAGAALVGGEVRLNLSTLAGGDGDTLITALVEIALVGRFAVTVSNKIWQRRVALVCVIAAGAVLPRLRLDLHALNISLPELDLPDWTFDTGFLRFSSWGTGLCRGLARNDLGVTVSLVAAAGAAPQLATRLNTDGSLDWALVPAGTTTIPNWSAPPLETLSATLTAVGGTTTVQIGNLTASQLGGVLDVAGKPTVTGSIGPIGGPRSGSAELGPLAITWSDVTFTLVGDSTADPLLGLQIEFERLQLHLIDDPATVIAFKGKVLVSPSHLSIQSLELIQPYPIKLVVSAAQTLADAASSVARVIVDLARATAEQVREILRILGRIAVAIGRAVAFVAGQVAKAMARALAALAELIGKVISQLYDWLAKAGQSLAIELRISTDPWQLRQILLTPTGARTPTPPIDALGLTFVIPDGWRPGLLIDLANDPGAYWVVSNEANKALVATIRTNLWLRDGDTSSAVRDADPKNGEAAKKPLIALEITQNDPAKALMVVVAGIRQGQPVLFKRFAGESRAVQIPNGPAVRRLDGDYALADFNTDDFSLKFSFEKDRILSLLGVSAPPQKDDAPNDSFLERLQQSIANVVWIKDHDFDANLAERRVDGHLLLGVKAGGVETEARLGGRLSLDTLEFSFTGADAGVPIKSRRIQTRALGLDWVIEQANTDERKENAEIGMFHVGFAGAQSGMTLNLAGPADKTEEQRKGKARMQLRLDGLSNDGKGLVFDVTGFSIGPGGLNLQASVGGEPVTLRGIDAPFRFSRGEITIRNGGLVSAFAEGKGALPPKLVGEAQCRISLCLGSDERGNIELKSGQVQLEKLGEPLTCTGLRFQLTVTDIGLGIVKDEGYHFYFQISGSLRFVPKGDEFSSGLLQYLDGVEMVLERTPLAADPRVLARHISFQKSLNPKKTFTLFNLFTFEIRGFGYHPAAAKFGGDPAINISGQVRFVEAGDVMQPSIDFHGLWLALPAKDESLPRIRADGLGVDLNLKGSVRIKGAVLALDKDTRTVEGAEYAPDGYDMSGFLGSGELTIPGFGSLGTNMGFVELQPIGGGVAKKAFYLYAEKRRMAVEITTPIWVFYLREFGFGFGFRYTLEAIKAADNAVSVPGLVKALDEISKRQGDLHRFTAWRPDPEGDKVTLALKGAMQTIPAEKTYDAKVEESAQNPFFFDLVAAIRSDFTLFMGARGWLATNYHDYQANTDNLREKPGFRGYLYISAPQKRLLLRAIGDSAGYIGDRIPVLARDPKSKEEPPLRRALRAIDWSSTLFIKPGLLHYEFGWPNQLAVRLLDTSQMRLVIRGGMIFRATEDGLLWAYNLEAEAFFRFGGELQAGPLGVAAEATLEARLVARVLAYLSWRLRGSLLYGLISLDAALTVRFRAWLRIDLRFTSFTIRIGFSFSLQLSAAIEAVISDQGVGARVHARVGVSVFGRTVSVAIGFEINPRQLADARARVQQFLSLGIGSEEPDTTPQMAHAQAAGTAQAAAAASVAVVQAPVPAETQVPSPVDNELVDRRHAWLGTPIRETHYWLVLRRAGAAPKDAPSGESYAYALLIPREAMLSSNGDSTDAASYSSSFFCAPTRYETGDDRRGVGLAYRLELGKDEQGNDVEPLSGCLWWAHGNHSTAVPVPQTRTLDITSNWGRAVETESPDASDTTDDAVAVDPRFSLAHLLDECFLYDAAWIEAGETPWRRTLVWCEPSPQISAPVRADEEDGSEASRLQRREQLQRGNQADGLRNPIVDQVHQARSTVLAMFLEQFRQLSQTGERGDYAHVADTGLVFYGPVEELVKLQMARVAKTDQIDDSRVGRIELMNPRAEWFDRLDPVLAPDAARKYTHGQASVGADGIKLAWQLQRPFAQERELDPEHFLDCYEITRQIEGLPPSGSSRRIKRSASIGATDANFRTTLLPAEWQYSDDLGDLPAGMRKALLAAHGDTDEMSAALAWAEQFAGSESITITYSVVPWDIAGSAGQAKGFVVTIAKPQPPLRAAEAELRFLLTVGDDDPANGRDPLCVILALGDKAGNDGRSGNADVKIVREYELIADPEEIAAAGRYGIDSLGERELAPPAHFIESADQIVWKLDAAAFEKPSKNELLALEDDDRTLDQFPQWRRLAGPSYLHGIDDLLPETPPLRVGPAPAGLTATADFLGSLWSRNTGRIATRFWLRTVQTVTVGKGEQARSFVSSSRPVPVAVELRLQRRDLKTATADLQNRPVPPTLLRPETFEWPSRFAHLPQQQGQVETSTGFAQWRMPRPCKSLADLLDPKQEAIMLQRDPQRRVMTEIRFEAAARPDDATDATRSQCIAAYDLFELDIDDLARLDTTDTRLEQDYAAWRRARPVAQVQRVSPRNANLLPGDNRDWQGWQASYPSEAWRIATRGSRPGVARPERAPWYSAAESTIAFAERVPRMRFLATVPAANVRELFQSGEPNKIDFSLSVIPGSPAEALIRDVLAATKKTSLYLPLTLHPLSLQSPQLTGEAREWPAEAPAGALLQAHVLRWKQREPLSYAQATRLLLQIGWTLPADADAPDDWKALVDLWRSRRNSLDGLNLVICARGVTRRPTTRNPAGTQPVGFLSGSSTIALTLDGFVHPLLQEVLGELEYHGAGEQLYRRYLANAQNVQPIEESRLGEYLAATPAELDPYGWRVLQQLGLAATLTLYDLDQDRELDAQELHARIEPVLRVAQARYRALPGLAKTAAGCAGVPLVDVLLKPMRDREAAPFDSSVGAAVASNFTFLADDGLAIAQIALRPAPQAVWHYRGLRVKLAEGKWPLGSFPEWSDLVRIDAYELLIKNELDEAVSVFSVEHGRSWDLEPGAGIAVPLFAQTASLTIAPALALRAFIVRLRDASMDLGRLRFTLRANVAERIEGKQDEPYTERPVQLSIDALLTRLQANCLKPGPAHYCAGLARPGVSIDEGVVDLDSPALSGENLADFAGPAHERFGICSEDGWKQAWNDADSPLRAAFDSLRQNLVRAAPELDLARIAGASANTYTTLVLEQLPPYRAWSQHFLDHGAAPAAALDATEARVPFALAAPLKSHPWQLAPDRSGMLQLSFLHSDRFAHARAYAVRPASRYAHLFEQAEDGQPLPAAVLVDDKSEHTIGYALAVVPRTERLEPPVLLESSIDGEDWQLVLARHSEEDLAFSNRPLFARLGTQGNALGFVREYREPQWPRRLSTAFKLDQPFDCHPSVEPRAPSLPGASAIDAPLIDGLAKRHPALWKGADVWRVAGMLPHYRLKALAVARAGVVVSRVVALTLDDTPRSELRRLASDWPKPRLEIVREGGRSVMRIVEARLVAPADLSTDRARRDWLDETWDDASNIGWWPDPDVRYSVLRCQRSTDFSGAMRQTEEEIAALEPVPRGTGEDKAVPLLQRSRSAAYAAEPTGLELQVLAPAAKTHTPACFQLTLALRRIVQGEVYEARFASADAESRRRLREAAAEFARLYVVVKLKVEWDAHDPNGEEIRAKATAIVTYLEAAPESLRDELAAAIGHYRAIASDLVTDRDALFMRLNQSQLVDSVHEDDLLLLDDPSQRFSVRATGIEHLVLLDLPPNDRLGSVQASGHPCAADGGVLWQLAQQLLLGTATHLRWRAVDSRRAIVFDGGKVSAPGELTVDIILPPWVQTGAPA